MRVISQSKLIELQNKPSNIRNICILAHVDHGKTTLADSLVASNGIISQKMAGKLRYMDSRKDEQERGITMKSSCITLYFSPTPETEVLVNLIDSPGHVDFSSEVSTAVRLCDGAIVIVDVVEGVCPQTRVALKQAWLENIKPILVLNKIDRLITEMKLSPLDAYVHLNQILEQMNAVMGELFVTDVMEKTDATETIITTSTNKNQQDVYDWSTGIEDADDSNLYFSPETGNVIFASAVDGWGFGIQEFAKMYSEKLGFKEELLNKVLWGDFYLNSKTKRVMKGAQEKAKKPLFVQLVLENIWNLYDIVILRKDKEKIGPIVEKLGIKLTTRDLRLTDMRLLLQAITNQWLPLANAVLNAVFKKLPSPLEITADKVEKLMCSQNTRFDFLPSETQALKEHFLSCNGTSDVPVIVYISKMFPVEKKSLPENKPKPLTMEEIAQRRELARSRHAQKQLDIENTTTLMEESENVSSEVEKIDDDEDAFIAFARVFSGVLRKGIELYVLGPKHNPALTNSVDIDPTLTLKDLRANQHVTKVTIDSLYLLMGRELELLEEVPAGNVLGIGGLDEHVLKTATLSTTLFCPSFTEMQLMAVPIVRVAVEPKNPADIPKLRKGLRLLNQADACVQVLIQETGEHVLITAGEVHLERCIDDLQQRYAKIELNVSEPIVPFRETIVEPPTVDMVNETIEVVKKEETDTLITMWTPNKQMCICLRAIPIPQNVTNLLEDNNDLLKTVDKVFGRKKIIEKLNKLKINELEKEHLAERTLKRINFLKDELEKEFMQDDENWKDIINNMMCVGPRKCGPNIFWNKVKDYPRSSMWENFNELSDPRIDFDASLLNGFQLATLSGPMCEEPMMGVCFVLESWSYDPTVVDTGVYGPLSGQVVSVVKEGCRKAFQAQPQRLMAAMYSCNILANTEVLGKMYAVLGRRNGRILSGDMAQGSANFVITAVLPVVESFQFAGEIRKQTSGLASPQLVFSHWEIIEIDPHWTPNTEEEYLHFGEKADSANRARQYMDSVRRRKGLHVETKLVEFAEKQRTIKKNK